MADTSKLQLILEGKRIVDPKVEKSVTSKRYYQPGERSWTDMVTRIADHVATAERTLGPKVGAFAYSDGFTIETKFRDKFLAALDSQNLVASSPIIFNAGTPCKMLSACTGVVFADDSIEAIFKAVSELATLTADGAGVGFNITPLRYRAAPLSRKGESSGACSFLENMDAVGKTIRQGGRNRRAAMLAALDIRHPDAVEFCFIKDDTSKLTHMNISLMVTDDFMGLVAVDGTHTFEFPVGSGNRVTLAVEPTDMDAKPDPRYPIFKAALESGDAQGQELDGKLFIEAVKARWLFNLIAEHAHKSGEPGLLFVDAHQDQNPLELDAPITTTNPCGEIGLNQIDAVDLGLPAFDANGIPEKAHDSCNLTHIVLPRMVRRVYIENGMRFALDELGWETRERVLREKTWRFEVDWEKLRQHIILGTRFLDNVIELSEYRPEKIGAANRAIRKTGLGVIGFADLLVMLGIDYRSQEALDFSHQLASWLEFYALEASADLARERGSFAMFEKSKYAKEGLDFRSFPLDKAHPSLPLNQWEGLSGRVQKGLRNAMVTMLAPTGSTALIVGNLSNSIEPIFFKEQRRRTVDAVEIVERHWLYEAFKNGELPGYVTEDLFVEAFQVSPREHVAMQNAWQAWIGMSISKTINLPHTATVDDVKDAYREAWHGGAKGVTVYRDGSRGFQPVSNAEVKMDEKGKLDLAGAKQPLGESMIETAIKAKTAEIDRQIKDAIVGGVSIQTSPFIPRDSAVLVQKKPEMIFGIEPKYYAPSKPVPQFSNVIVHRPEVVQGSTAKVEFNGSKVFVTLNRAESGQPVEVFIVSDKAGSDRFAECEALGRLISTALKHGTRLSDIIKQLRGIGGETVGFYKGRRYASLADAVGTTLAELVGQSKPKTADDADAFVAAVQGMDFSKSTLIAPAPLTDDVLREAVRDVFDQPAQVLVTSPATTEALTSSFGMAKCPECKQQTYKKEASCGICTNCFYSQCK